MKKDGNPQKGFPFFYGTILLDCMPKVKCEGNASGLAE